MTYDFDPLQTPLRTQADLHDEWRRLMGPLGFASRRLWLFFLDPEMRPFPHLVQIDDIPEEPHERDVDGLMEMLLHVQDDHIGPAAILLSRPGEGRLRPSDRQWGRALLAAARRRGVPLTPIHLANDEALVPLTGDDLLATG